MSVKRVDRGRSRVSKTWEDRAIEFEEDGLPELPLVCKLASALSDDGWKTYVKVPNKDGFPTLIVKNTSKRRKREEKQRKEKEGKN